MVFVSIDLTINFNVCLYVFCLCNYQITDETGIYYCNFKTSFSDKFSFVNLISRQQLQICHYSTRIFYVHHPPPLLINIIICIYHNPSRQIIGAILFFLRSCTNKMIIYDDKCDINCVHKYSHNLAIITRVLINASPKKT